MTYKTHRHTDARGFPMSYTVGTSDAGDCVVVDAPGSEGQGGGFVVLLMVKSAEDFMREHARRYGLQRVG